MPEIIFINFEKRVKKIIHFLSLSKMCGVARFNYWKSKTKLVEIGRNNLQSEKYKYIVNLKQSYSEKGIKN